MTVNDIGKIALSVAVTQLLADLLSRKLVFNKEGYKETVATFQRVKDKHDKTAAALDAKKLLYAQQQKDPQAAGKKSSQQISKKSLEKDEKRLKFESDELTAQAAEVARRHTSSNLYSVVAFLILYRVLATEYSGKIVALLPFEPFHLLQKIMTFRGLAGAAGVSTSTEFHFKWVKAVAAEAGGESITKPLAPLSPEVTHACQACAFAFIYFLCNMTVKVIVSTIFGAKPPPGADEGVGTLMQAPQSKKMMENFGMDPDHLKNM